MKKIYKIAVSQRVDWWADRGERRDGLDQRLIRWLLTAGCLPIPIPNGLDTVGDRPDGLGLSLWLRTIQPDGIVLSGGNDLGTATDRDEMEGGLLDYAQGQVLPVLGICRGMQRMAVWAGGRLRAVDGHVGIRHRLQGVEGMGPWPDEVNSFHNFVLEDSPLGFRVAAWSGNGTGANLSIEAICHQSLPWEGWMWHPEREQESDRESMSLGGPACGGQSPSSPKINAGDRGRFLALLQSRGIS